MVVPIRRGKEPIFRLAAVRCALRWVASMRNAPTLSALRSPFAEDAVATIASVSLVVYLATGAPFPKWSIWFESRVWLPLGLLYARADMVCIALKLGDIRDDE